MKRKIIRQGHNTLTITLPSDWSKRFNLGAGKEVDLTERDNGLFISAEKIDNFKKAEFDITGMDIPTIWKYFMAVYREGYDEVLVKFKPESEIENPYKFFAQNKLDLKYKREAVKKNVYEAMQGFVNRFIGFEIVEHGSDFVLIREMGQPSSKDFDSSLRRVFLLIQQMAEEIAEAIEKSNAHMLLHIHDVDVNIDKFHDYCIRILNKIGNKEPRKSELLFSTLYLLELIGDEFKNASHHVIYDLKLTRCEPLNRIAQIAREEVKLFYELFYKFDNQKIMKISEMDKQLYFSINELFKKTKQEYEKEIMHHLRMICRYINALTELRIEMEF